MPYRFDTSHLTNKQKVIISQRDKNDELLKKSNTENNGGDGVAIREFIENYSYQGYEFKIEFSKRDKLYYASSQFGETYDKDLNGVKSKIKTVVYQNTQFKL